MSVVILNVVPLGIILLNVIAPQFKHIIHVILWSVILLSVVVPNIILLGVILLNVAPPQIQQSFCRVSLR